MNRLFPTCAGFCSNFSAVFLFGLVLLVATLSPANALSATLNDARFATQPPQLMVVNRQTKLLLHVNEMKFAKAPVDRSIKSEKARDILLDQEGIQSVKAPGVKSADSGKTIATFLHLNPMVASNPAPSIPTELETLKATLTKRGVEVPTTEPQTNATSAQPMVMPGDAAKS